MKIMMKHHGFSLPEALVASAILAIVVTGVLTMVGDGSTVSDVFRTRVQGNNSCLISANQVMGKFKERGLIRSRHNFVVPPVSGGAWGDGVESLSVTVGSNLEKEINDTDRWADPIYYAAAVDPRQAMLRPHHLLMGYMTALQAIYNSDRTGFCTAARGKSTYTGNAATGDIWLEFAGSEGLRSPVSYVKIVPFNTSTGALDGACPDIDIRPPRPNETSIVTESRLPPGLTTANHPNSANVEVFDVATGPAPISTHGFAVTVTITHTDEHGQARECSVSERFQYGMQPENPLEFEFEDIDTPGSPLTAVSNDVLPPENMNQTTRLGAANPPYFSDTTHTLSNANKPVYYACGDSVNRRINFRLQNVRPGSIMMCRNLSMRRPVGTADGYDDGTGGAITMVTDNAGTERMNTTADDRDGMYVWPSSTDNNHYGKRQTFYSTELLRHAYFAQQDAVDGTSGDLFIAGIYYPAGTYKCRSATDNCKGLPIFPYGADNGNNVTENNGGLPTFGAGPQFLMAAPSTTTNDNSPTSTMFTHYPKPSDHATTTLSRSTSTTTNATGGTNQWIPCEKLSVICGQTTTVAAGFVGGDRTDTETTDDTDGYNLQISGLPRGCEVHIQMAEVDAAYNVKATEFREYMQEQLPGNYLCRSGSASPIPSGNAHGNGDWFFSCSAAPPTATVCNAANSIGDPPTTSCCIPFPIYPHGYKAFHDP